MRQRMKEFSDLPLELKQAMRKKYQWFKDLPEDERERLRNRWQNLSPEQKQEVHERLRSTPIGQHNSLQNNLIQQQNRSR